MLQRVISLDCGARQLARARDTLSSLSGVVAAELVALVLTVICLFLFRKRYHYA